MQDNAALRQLNQRWATKETNETVGDELRSLMRRLLRQSKIEADHHNTAGAARYAATADHTRAAIEALDS